MGNGNIFSHKVPYNVQSASREAAKKTKNRRSKLVEKVEKLVSSWHGIDKTSLHTQRVNNIAQDKAAYMLLQLKKQV